ncbi:hypothetical protein [Haladaptatus caseinilyticus]|uniref:hypothetical protein n=1 Tax=Haladaptatus caseinilyticus TaxID=2993314 RepID=UPI00224B7DB9|nr:hypothetical protein [Haladaptatus caseinilyticus]
MSTSTLPRTLILGDNPRTSVRALVAGLVITGLAVTLRFVSPTILLGPELSLLAAVVGFFLAVAVGRYKGGVLVGIFAAAIPVFALNTASTAILEPISLDLAIRAVRSSAWYTIGVAVLVVGPLGYALGRSSPSGGESVRSHFCVDRNQYGPLLVWSFIALGVAVLWTVLPVSAMLSSVAFSPVPAATGLVVAAILGYRARGAPAAAIAGGIGVSVGIRLFTQGFSTLEMGMEASPSLIAIGTVMFIGFVDGIPLGLVGYRIGRTI